MKKLNHKTPIMSDNELSYTTNSLSFFGNCLALEMATALLITQKGITFTIAL
jgi:hypothetical protein